MKNKQKIYTILLQLSLILLIILLVSPILLDTVFARPGGGSSYSGGGGGGYSGGGGGGSGGGDGIGIIIYLLMSLPPQISVPLIIIIIVFYVISQRKRKTNVTINSTPTYDNRANFVSNSEQKIDELKAKDANFSKVLFLEFVSSLYNKYYNYQNKAEFKNLSPFLAEHISKEINSMKVKRQFDEIVIGSLNISTVSFLEGLTSVAVDIDANYTVSIMGKSTRFIVTERWLLNRKAGILSQSPDIMRKLACPNCGASSDFSDAGECSHCHTFIVKGDMQWFVKDRRIISQQTFATNSLLTYSQEIGTDYPTIYQRGLQYNIDNFSKNHNQQWNTYLPSFKESIVKTYFTEIYAAWTRQRWDEVRHLVADRLWESNQFWQDAYKRENLINKLENINISKIDIARIDLDKFYESITVRIFANCMDYVTDRSGKVMAGTNKKQRYFSEYWTFIRRTGVEKEVFDLKTCPSCGAPADKFGQAGICEYCNTKITTGDFSWILAIITQDEVYKG